MKDRVYKKWRERGPDNLSKILSNHLCLFFIYEFLIKYGHEDYSKVVELQEGEEGKVKT